jgi:sec-independent protein translocase protein TatB
MLRPIARPTQMFDVGFAELFLLAIIGLLVLGPERLPAVARTVGGYVRKARESWTSLRHTIEAELAEAALSEPIKKAHQEFKQIGKDLTDVPEYAAESLQTIKSDQPTDADESSDTTLDDNENKNG